MTFRLMALPPELWIHISKLPIVAELQAASGVHGKKLPATTQVCKACKTELLPCYLQRCSVVEAEPSWDVRLLHG